MEVSFIIKNVPITVKYVGRSGLNYLYEFTKVSYWLKEVSAYWFLAKTGNNVIYLLIVCLGKEFLGRIWAHCEILYFIISCYWVEVSYFKGDFSGFTSNFCLKVQQNKFVRALATIGSHVLVSSLDVLETFLGLPLHELASSLLVYVTETWACWNLSMNYCMLLSTD